jgi:hypothetical protein
MTKRPTKQARPLTSCDLAAIRGGDGTTTTTTTGTRDIATGQSSGKRQHGM